LRREEPRGSAPKPTRTAGRAHSRVYGGRATMRSGLSGQRLIAVFLGGTMLINFPLLALFDRPEPDLAGVPLLYLYVFLIWLALCDSRSGTVARLREKHCGCIHNLADDFGD